MLSKAEILGVDDRPVTVVSVPEWGGEIRLRCISALDRDRWLRRMYDDKGNLKNPEKSFQASFLALCIVDDTGARVFEDDDIDALAGKNAMVLDRLFREAYRLNGLSGLEEIEKNSGNQSGGSTSG